MLSLSNASVTRHPSLVTFKMNHTEKLLLNLVKSSRREGVFPLITVMLNSGVNPNVLDHDLGDISLLMLAVSIGNVELAEILIKHGADINYQDKVLSRCMLDNFTEGFDLILGAQGLSKESIRFAFFSSLLNNQRVVFTEKILAQYRVLCWYARDREGRSGMEFASRVKNLDALRLLEKTFVTYPE
jgi:hypothetical protein